MQSKWLGIVLMASKGGGAPTKKGLNTYLVSPPTDKVNPAQPPPYQAKMFSLLSPN